MCRTETDYYRPDNHDYCKIEEEIRKEIRNFFLPVIHMLHYYNRYNIVLKF